MWTVLSRICHIVGLRLRVYSYASTFFLCSKGFRLQCVAVPNFSSVCHMPPVVNRQYEIATIDIKNLYPSIDTEDLISAISAQIFIFYSGEPLFAQTLINLLALILRNQMVDHRGELYVAFGSATGLSPGVFLANLYLDELDRKVVQQHSENLGFFARLVDDSLVRALHVDDVLDTLNSWKPGIDWIVSARGGRSQLGEDEVPFLDIQLSHHMGHMAWRTFRKPLNRYLYLPRASAHPKNVFVALIAGETHRLWRSNRSRAHLFRELTFFVEKLADRGYARHVSWNVIRDTLKNAGRVHHTAHRVGSRTGGSSMSPCSVPLSIVES